MGNNIKYPKVDPMQSIFTSAFFTEFINVMLPHIDQQARFVAQGPHGHIKEVSRLQVPTKFDGEDHDLGNFVNKFGALLGDATCNISTGIGWLENGDPLIARADPLNTELALGMYRLRQHATTAKHYFPTKTLIDALNHTDLKWVDLQAFTDLPPLITVRLQGFKSKVNNEIHTIDDLLLVRDDTPATRRKALDSHRVAPEDRETALVFHWLTQSRDEINVGIQSHTFGTFVLHKNMKLDDIMTEIEEWADRETERVRKEAYTGGLLDRVDAARKSADTNLHMDPEEARIIQEHADYLTNTLTQSSVDAEQRRWHGELLRFTFKFVLLLSSEGVKVKALLPPGVKDKANLTRKAKKVHETLWAMWGRRYSVDVPAEYHSESIDHKSPIRHIVRGHFKQQPHGPNNSLRKIIWRSPFWRGETSLA